MRTSTYPVSAIAKGVVSAAELVAVLGDKRRQGFRFVSRERVLAIDRVGVVGVLIELGVQRRGAGHVEIALGGGPGRGRTGIDMG